MDYFLGNPNPNPAVNMAPFFSSDFEISDFLALDDVVDHHPESWSQSTETESSEKAAASSDASHGFGDATSTNNNM